MANLVLRSAMSSIFKSTTVNGGVHLAKREGTEELVTEPVAGDDSYTTNDEEMDEDIDYESFALEGFHEEELELDDFVNDEH